MNPHYTEIGEESTGITFDQMVRQGQSLHILEIAELCAIKGEWLQEKCKPFNINQTQVMLSEHNFLVQPLFLPL